MGIKGTVRRSVDGDFIHANVDIDLIIAEDPGYGSLEKAKEIFHIIEHFCLGRRRSVLQRWERGTGYVNRLWVWMALGYACRCRGWFCVVNVT